ncbi:hypothetical protein COMNV_00855 [Commensalibacter sp. Nvir]|uniref:hypothetical protein n=1 Tax=Commensalibacter sp. Nvir TaxID=3069817 RepID=UPI002D2B382C|nr:hypothetical protein COMNV_00855 [Commensalibacter sp. Nvir]
MDIKNNNNSPLTPNPGSFITGNGAKPLGGTAPSEAHLYVAESDEYFVKMKTTFTVPSIPTDTAGNYYLYLWPGLQSAKLGIFQPVLAFHSTYPSWYLHTYAIAPKGSSTPHQQGADYDVAVGTELTGVIELTQKTDNAYTYKVSFEGYPEATSCSQTWELPATIAWQYIENYYVTKRTQFPQEDTLLMKDILLVTNKGTLINLPWKSSTPKMVYTNKKVILPYWNQ